MSRGEFRDSKQARVLDEMLRLLQKYPSLRVCQLIGNSIPTEELQRRENDIYHIEDEQLLQWLREFESKADAARAEVLTQFKDE